MEQHGTLETSSKKKNEEQLVYYSNDYCVYCIMAKGIKNSSEATSSRQFHILSQPINELLHQNHAVEYLTKDDINQVFDKCFVSSGAANCILNELGECISGAGDTVSSEKIQMILQKRKTMMEMPLNYELPYNEWLYHLLERKLARLDFAIYQRDKTCLKPLAPLCEYMFCKSDILMYHSKM